MLRYVMGVRMNEQKKLIDLNKGDIVCYTGLNGKYYEVTFVDIAGFVQCVRGRGYTPNLRFMWNDKLYSAPLEAWLYAGMRYIVK